MNLDYYKIHKVYMIYIKSKRDNLNYTQHVIAYKYVAYKNPNENS